MAISISSPKLYMTMTSSHDWISGRRQYSWRSRNPLTLKTFANFTSHLYLIDIDRCIFYATHSFGIFFAQAWEPFLPFCFSYSLPLSLSYWCFIYRDYHTSSFLEKQFLYHALPSCHLCPIDRWKLRPTFFAQCRPVSTCLLLSETDQMSKGKNDGHYASVTIPLYLFGKSYFGRQRFTSICICRVDLCHWSSRAEIYFLLFET